MRTTRNDRGDLSTETRVDLAPGLVLIVTTRKGGRGIETDAVAYRTDRGFLSHTWALCSPDPLGSDYRRTLKTDPGRATQKALERQHIEALAACGGIETIARYALAHQTARAARVAEQEQARQAA